MADSNGSAHLCAPNQFALCKIISYVAAWLLALFAANPNGGLWALAWMFPLGLAARIAIYLA
jgi:hypothetical protein